ncbi:MAG: small multi-drug export protein [bacterium]|nr:small multi-drug export protein [bacterium]
MFELKTFLIAMSPVVELRGSIPIALEMFHLPLWSAYFFSVLGNMVPVLLLPFLGVVSSELSRRFSFLERFLSWLFLYTRKKHERSFELFRDFALVIFVAIPLPLTGAWTATLVAFVFGIPLRKAFPLILLGVIIAGVTVTLITLGITSI